jgi:sigma-B regulation protein RsbQ
MQNFSYSKSSRPAAALTTSAVLQRNNVHVIGEGKQSLLLCNGFGCNQHIWRYLVPSLSQHYQLILFDYVGTGETDIKAYDSQKYSSLAGYAQDVVEICQALALHDAVIMGHSIGAMIAMQAAIQAPEYFSKAILLTATPYCLNEPGYYGGIEQKDAHQMVALMEADYQTWATVFGAMLIGQTHPASLGEELVDYFCALDKNSARQFIEITLFSDNRADIPRLQLPTLLVQCADDVVAPTEVAEYMLQHLPQASLVTLPVEGHCPHLSAPLETLAAIQDFLASPSEAVLVG